MNNYDGPAFYRRFLQKSTANVQPDSYSNNKLTNNKRERHVADVTVSGPVSSATGNFRTNGENAIAKMTNAFQPKGNYTRKKTGDDYLNQSKLGHYYLKLIGELRKPDATCILFDDSLSTRANSDLIQFGTVDETTESIAAEQPVAPALLSSASMSEQRFEKAIDQHYAQLTSDEQYYQRLQSDQSQAPDQQSAPPTTSVNDGAALDDAETDGSGTSAVVKQPEVNSKPKSATVKHGLGHSLTAILNNEQAAQKDVEFFKSRATDNAVSSVSGDVKNSTTGSNQSDQEVESSSAPATTESSSAVPVSSVPPAPSTETIISADHKGYQFPQFTLLNEPQRQEDDDLDDWIINQSEVLEQTLHAFHVNAEVVDWTNGPTVTQFQVRLALGVKVSKITNLNDDLKMALAAKDIRIEAPIPGQTTVGVEIPNPKPRPVMLSEVLTAPAFAKATSPLTIALGVDLTGRPQLTDIAKMPHGLIAGATGSGKSVFINSLLVSLLYKATPAQLRLLLIDPKAVELAPYNNIPHLLAPVISEPNEASAALKWAVKEMDERYEKLAAAGARNIEQFNQKAIANQQPELQIPYIVIIIDELADLMMVASTEVQDYIVRITQKARAAGIHLMVATQRPSVDIVTGTIKNNIPTRIAFMVSSQVDSRTIIDTAGAERLLGRGDMLYLGNGKSQPLRIQGTFVTNEEIERVTAAVKKQGTPQYAFNPKSLLKKANMVQQQDDLMPEVLAYIAKEKTVSTSKLQRVFSIGYNRAASLIDDLEQQNYISGQHGSKPREVYLTEADYQKLNL